MTSVSAVEYHHTLPFLIHLEARAARSAGSLVSADIAGLHVESKTIAQGRRHQYRVDGKVVAFGVAVATINAAIEAQGTHPAGLTIL